MLHENLAVRPLIVNILLQMGIFKGKRKKGLFLSSIKRISYNSKVRGKTTLNRTLNTSTPLKKGGGKRVCQNSYRKKIFSPALKRSRILSPIPKISDIISKPIRHTSNSYSVKAKKELAFNSLERSNISLINDSSEETYIYSDGAQLFETEADIKESSFETNDVKDRPYNDDIHQLFDEVLDILKEHNVKADFVTFLTLVAKLFTAEKTKRVSS
jgi:hypothetical protein